MYITATYEDAVAHNPPNFVTTDDGYTLEPGQYLRLTFDATVDDPLATGIEEIANTAYVTSNEFPLSLEASVTNTVVNPSAESAEVGDRVWFDLDGDGVFDVGEPGLTLIFGSGNTSTPDFPAMIPAP
ncbi:MAG: hypothetical protein GY801_48825, partial [bacterium]|nr:hypothetical protein [bacterium]